MTSLHILAPPTHLAMLFLKLFKVDNPTVMTLVHSPLSVSIPHSYEIMNSTLYPHLQHLGQLQVPAGGGQKRGPGIPTFKCSRGLRLPKHILEATPALMYPRRWKEEFPG